MSSSHVLGVLDLTFLEIEEETDFMNGFALRQNPPSPQKTIEGTPSPGKSPGSKKEKKPEVIKAVRLSNNLIRSMDIIGSCITSCLDSTKIQ